MLEPIHPALVASHVFVLRRYTKWRSSLVFSFVSFPIREPVSALNMLNKFELDREYPNEKRIVELIIE